jgi:hypothetical protein
MLCTEAAIDERMVAPVSAKHPMETWNVVRVPKHSNETTSAEEEGLQCSQN